MLKTDVNGALSKYFFGANLDEKVSYQKFIDFHRQIHDEVLWIEVRASIDSCYAAGVSQAINFQVTNQVIFYSLTKSYR